MSARHTCPRRREDGTDTTGSPFRGAGPDQDTYGAGHGLVGQRRGCSYCGSMSGGDFLAAVRDGKQVGPTDKAYKFYVDEMTGKFYTPHLTEDQADEFRQLWLDGNVNWGYPGHPYVPIFLPGYPKAEASA